MASFTFVIITLAFSVFAYNKKDVLQRRGRERFVLRGQTYTPSPGNELFPKRVSQNFPTASPTKHNEKKSTTTFENTHCELCSSPPRVQYKNKDRNFTLEFCHNHSAAKQSTLLASGFTKTLLG